jgi:hypothetical protein
MGKRSPLAVDTDGRKYVRTTAVMSNIIPLIDGIPVTFFGRGKQSYLRLEDAIAWVEKEMEYHSREKYEVVLEVLRRFRDQDVPRAACGDCGPATPEGS